MPKSEDSRGLRQILRESGKGNSADQSEVNAAVGRMSLFIVPFFVLLISIHLAAALPLYWLTASVVAIIQQAIILKEDVKEAEVVADAPAEKTPKPKNKKSSKSKPSSKRRKK